MTIDLEQLIEAILADGIITDKERAVLHQRAEREGISADEIDVLVDGRLVKMQGGPSMPPPLANEPKPQKQGRNVQTYGVVQKCPNCGAPIQTTAMQCSECGYEFRGVGANSSVERLSTMLCNAVAKHEKNEALQNIVISFPVPSTKEDLLEFIFYTKSKSRTTIADRENPMPEAYRKKYYECIDKAKFYFAQDPQFQRIFKEHSDYKRQYWSNLNPKVRIGILIALGWLALVIFGICMSE